MTRKSSSARPPSQRQLRVGEMVRHALSQLLTRGVIHNDVINSTVITIPEVRMSPDLKLATAYVLPIGGQDASAIVSALTDNKKFIRKEVARMVQLKYAPDVRFREDESFEDGMRIDELLASSKVRRDIEQN